MGSHGVVLPHLQNLTSSRGHSGAPPPPYPVVCPHQNRGVMGAYFGRPPSPQKQSVLAGADGLKGREQPLLPSHGPPLGTKKRKMGNRRFQTSQV